MYEGFLDNHSRRGFAVLFLLRGVHAVRLGVRALHPRILHLPTTASFSRFHAALEGQLGSEGRTRRMAGLANALRGHSCESDTAPDAFKNSLRFKAATCFLSVTRRLFLDGCRQIQP
jgi:hypothetical protein